MERSDVWKWRKMFFGVEKNEILWKLANAFSPELFENKHEDVDNWKVYLFLVSIFDEEHNCTPIIIQLHKAR